MLPLIETTSGLPYEPAPWWMFVGLTLLAILVWFGITYLIMHWIYPRGRS